MKLPNINNISDTKLETSDISQKATTANFKQDKAQQVKFRAP